MVGEAGGLPETAHEATTQSKQLPDPLWCRDPPVEKRRFHHFTFVKYCKRAKLLTRDLVWASGQPSFLLPLLALVLLTIRDHTELPDCNAEKQRRHPGGRMFGLGSVIKSPGPWGEKRERAAAVIQCIQNSYLLCELVNGIVLLFIFFAESCTSKTQRRYSFLHAEFA